MIKELNYYLTTNKFSQIAEEIENSVREYAKSLESGAPGNAELREKARLVCEKQMIESGMGDEDSSFINIDYEFFDGGELVESSLNRFIKDVLKAHGYQKILWEYMGTTGLMTDISRAKMKEDGFEYEKFLPASLRKTEIVRNENKICRNFNKLKDDSGFDWKQGYDPNYTVKKDGWGGAFDENLVWNYYKTNELENKIADVQKNTYKIQLVKTENGCMLYDSQEVLLNPICLWYLTANNEVYGAKKTDASKIICDIKEQMKVLGVSKITEVASNGSSETLDEYKKMLGKLASEHICAVSSKVAENQIKNNQNAEKISVLQNEAGKLQQKIDAMLNANSELSASDILSGLETDRINVNLDLEKDEDSGVLGITDSELLFFKKCNKNLGKDKSKDFKKAVTVLCSNWEQYKSCGKTRAECLESIYDYIKDGKKSVFSYQKSLREVILVNTEQKELSVEDVCKKYLPSQNLDAALEYIASIPEQDTEKKQAVETALKNAAANYIDIRSSTGMSIKELFDYSIKSNGGRLPKSSFVPPTIGYINPKMQQKADEGSRSVYFENDIENFIAKLCACDYPQKEVSVSELLKLQSKNSGSVQKILSGKTPVFDMLYDTGNEENIAIIASMLKERFSGKKYSKLADSDYMEYASQLNESVYKIIHSENYSSAFISGIKPSFIQAEIAESGKTSLNVGENILELPKNYKMAQEKQNSLSGIEHLSVLSTRVNGKIISNQKSSVKNDVEESSAKQTAELLQSLSKAQKEEIIHAAGDESLVTPLLIKEYLWRKENGKSTKNVYADVTSYQSLSSMSAADLQTFVTSNAVNAGAKTVSYGGKSGVPVVKLSTEQKEYFKQNYGIPTSGLSPVVKEYIRSGEWKQGKVAGRNNRFSEQPSFEVTQSIQQPAVKLHVENGGQSHINVDEPYSMSEELREAMQKVADSRKMNVEDSKMARINANYEHDKAVLAKTDPAFAAKNQFWDVGHAEESGELSEREIERIASREAEKELRNLKEEML